MRCLIVCLCFSLCWSSPTQAQSKVAATPVVGLRDNPVESVALIHADVVVEPGKTLTDATVLIEGTSITAVGVDLEIPDGFEQIDCAGKRLYAGLIDTCSETEVPFEEAAAGYWNRNVLPQRTASTAIGGEIDDAGKLRSQGIAVRVIAPQGGIVKGSSCVCLTGDDSDGRTLLRKNAWNHLQLTVPRTGSRPRYPNSPMGAVALLRQSLYDAKWYRQAWDAYQATPELPRPETNVALEALADAMENETFVIDAPNDRMALRADDIAREFSLSMIIRGSGREYQQLNEVVSANRTILVPVDFPDAPNVKTANAVANTTLQTLLHWDLAPENPGRLANAGVPICLTTDGLADVGDFLDQVRKAVNRGLSKRDALAAMTTTPARALGMESMIGRIAPGMIANLLISDGDLLDDDTDVLESWVAGQRFKIREDRGDEDVLVGRWSFDLRQNQASPAQLVLEFESKSGRIQGQLRHREESDTDNVPASKEDEDDSADDDSSEEENGESDTDVSKVSLKDLVRQRDRLSATMRLHKLDPKLPAGITQITIVTFDEQSPKDRLVASLRFPDGDLTTIPLVAMASERGSADEESDDDAPAQDEPSEGLADVSDDRGDDETSSSEENSDVAVAKTAPTPNLFPVGAYGLESPVVHQPTVLFRGATVWTCDDQGVLDSADVLIRDGVIAEVGTDLDAPAGCITIDASGKHITPGLIDCHSHMGTDGGVNESGQAVTAEVRIGDFIDNSDIQIYRQMAGGLTTSNILHGSANPIGGQNQVIKLRWGSSMDDLRMKESPQGIKFALGENVKRSTSRYPNTRMGVEQIIRDQLLAAREYQSKWNRWRSGERDTLPPRTDLQLQALAEVQNGSRWIHCHSYRQDEIVATLDVLEEFGIQIGTLQHILEGYKVADRIARHGAMASSFSDWWAYKFEVFDAIPYNGALMHERGVVVSFNSDDREIARHLNTEAAKATKYGGVPEIEALKFVTLNPARQLRIDQYVGSLTPGKHADLVVWSGRPLSTLSRCEQTWIDGRRYFDLSRDQDLRSRDRKLKATLVQKALGYPDRGDAKESTPKVAEENRWVRHDIYCAAHGSHEYDYTGNLRNQEANQ
jgi:N-acetylglucosamine-6-phosphate deacetylase